MQHDEAKCKKCGGFVVGKDAIDAMSNGLCSHCQRHTYRKPKTEEEKRLHRAHREAKLAERAMKNQAARMPGGKKR
jgi:hypothetical protein